MPFNNQLTRQDRDGDRLTHSLLLLWATHQNATSYISIEKYRLYGDVLVAQNPRPVRHKGISVCWIPRCEGCHKVRVRIQLLLEENGEVAFYHIPQ